MSTQNLALVFLFDMHMHGALQALRSGQIALASDMVRRGFSVANAMNCGRRKSAAFRILNWLRVAMRAEG